MGENPPADGQTDWWAKKKKPGQVKPIGGRCLPQQTIVGWPAEG